MERKGIGDDTKSMTTTTKYRESEEREKKIEDFGVLCDSTHEWHLKVSLFTERTPNNVS